MAHEDINVSQQWRDRILEELRRMEVFVPILSANFRSSDWTSQEAGAAAVRPDVLIIPVSLDGTIPSGFLGHFQCKLLPRPAKSDFFRSVLLNERPHAVIGTLIDALDEAWNFRRAEAVMAPLVPYFDQLTPDEAERIVDKASGNNQIWDAAKCRTSYLPQLLAAVAGKVDQEKLDKLRKLIR